MQTNNIKKAKFIGQDGSMGYKNGEVYTILVEDRTDHLVVTEGSGLYQPCPYSNQAAFEANWEVLEAQADTSHLIIVDRREVAALADKGGELVFNVKAEDALIKLFEMERVIAEALAQAKNAIAEAGLKYNPNFTSVQGDKVKAGYRFYGAVYKLDEAHLKDLPVEFYKTKVTHSPETKAIDEYLKTNKQLPLGINAAERSKTLSLRPLVDFEGAQ